MFGDWQIKVEKIVITDTLSQYGSVYTPTNGRFALIFMTVVNRGTGPKMFGAWVTIDLIDGNGMRYGEFPNGTYAAMDIYGVTDMLNYI